MNQEKIEAKLLDAGVPAARVEAKATDSAIGWVLTLIGTGAFIVGSAAVLLIILGGGEVGMWVVLLVTLCFGAAVTFVGLGLHLVAREAAPSAIRGIADAIVLVITAVRGKGAGPDA